MAQRPRSIVLLDLDGTLTDSAPGIIASVCRTFRTLGLPVPDDAELRRFIGPSIIASLRRNHVPEDLVEEGLRVYRSHYAQNADAFDDPGQPGSRIPGMLLNAVYEGIPEQLARLRHHGLLLAVATCKPEYMATAICSHFGLDSLVDGIYGASRDESRSRKDQVIRYAFDELGFDADAGDRALMVGDRWTDADGARACGLDCLGCGWGYAEPGELERHGAYHVIDTVAELGDAVDGYFSS